MPHDPDDRTPIDEIEDEAIAEIVEYCRSIQGKRLKVFDLIDPSKGKNAEPIPASELPPGVTPGDLMAEAEWTTARVEEIKAVIDYMADYSDPVTEDELIGYYEADIDATADFICTLRTVEALIGVKDAISSYGLKPNELKEFSKDLTALIARGAALISLFFVSDHRYYYETVGDFQKGTDEFFKMNNALIFRLVKALRDQGAP